MIYVLIVIFGVSSRPATLSVEFNDMQSCEHARKYIAAQSGEYPKYQIRAQGCFAKGAAK